MEISGRNAICRAQPLKNKILMLLTEGCRPWHSPAPGAPSSGNSDGGGRWDCGGPVGGILFLSAGKAIG
jgi:hypothetical protein